MGTEEARTTAPFAIVLTRLGLGIGTVQNTWEFVHLRDGSVERFYMYWDIWLTHRSVVWDGWNQCFRQL